MLKTTLQPDDPKFCPFYPGSIVLVSVVDADGRADVCTVGAWALVNAEPCMFGIALCQRGSSKTYRKRYTTKCVEETGEFVINIPDVNLVRAWNICGSISLVDEPEADKFKAAGLTPVPASQVKAPLIAECVINIECKVYKRLALPTHDWIVGQPVLCHAAKGVLDGTLYLDWTPAVRLVPQE